MGRKPAGERCRRRQNRWQMSWPSIPSVEIALDDSVEFVDTSDGVVEEATEGGGSPDTAASEADEGEREGGGDGGRTKRGWSAEVDPSTGNTYYHNDEGTVTWEKPAGY